MSYCFLWEPIGDNWENTGRWNGVEMGDFSVKVTDYTVIFGHLWEHEDTLIVC